MRKRSALFRFPEGTEEQKIPSRDDSGSALRKLQRHRRAQQPHRDHFGESYQRGFHLLESGRLAAEARHSFRFGIATVPKPQTPQGRQPSHTAPYSRISFACRPRPLTDVSKRLGHVNPRVTANVYAHALRRDGLAAAAWEKFQKDGKPAKAQKSRKVASKS